jgi:hypothetical protein
MGVSDLLLIGIEVSVAFAGFAGIVATFQTGEGKVIRRGTVSGLTLIVQYSLAVAFFCALPRILFEFSLPERNVWSICSILAAIATVGLSYSAFINTRGAIRRRYTFFLVVTLHFINVPVVLGLIFNAADMVFHREAGPYLVALTYPLIMVGYMFSNLLLQPLWRSLRQQENMKLGQT